eukprot:3002300-Alexandrium_andersonii.AAC.1
MPSWARPLPKPRRRTERPGFEGFRSAPNVGDPPTAVPSPGGAALRVSPPGMGAPRSAWRPQGW